MADEHPIHHPSAMRNRHFIATELHKLVPDEVQGDALEIGSGTGAHVELFAQEMPHITWHTSEYLSDLGEAVGKIGGTAGAPSSEQRVLDVIDQHGSQQFDNVQPAVGLDASLDWDSWPDTVTQKAGLFKLVYCSNIFHISPWAVSCGILAGAGAALVSGGVLAVYGPFKVDGDFTSEGNAKFDASLRQRNPLWGYREVSDVEAQAAKHGLALVTRIEHAAANNLILHFVKQ